MIETLLTLAAIVLAVLIAHLHGRAEGRRALLRELQEQRRQILDRGLTSHRHTERA